MYYDACFVSEEGWDVEKLVVVFNVVEELVRRKDPCKGNGANKEDSPGARAGRLEFGTISNGSYHFHLATSTLKFSNIVSQLLKLLF